MGFLTSIETVRTRRGAPMNHENAKQTLLSIQYAYYEQAANGTDITQRHAST